MTQFIAAVNAGLSDGGGEGGGSGSGAPDRSGAHEPDAPGGKRMSCPGGCLSVVTGQWHEDCVWSVVAIVQVAFRQLANCACGHDSVSRGNWAYEKFEIPLDACRPMASCRMDSPLWTTVQEQVT